MLWSMAERLRLGYLPTKRLYRDGEHIGVAVYLKIGKRGCNCGCHVASAGAVMAAAMLHSEPALLTLE